MWRRFETKRLFDRTSPMTAGTAVMCEKCTDIDDKIERCRNIRRSINDQATVDGAVELIADLEALKAVLHPERDHGAEFMPDPPRTEEARRLIEEYADDLRETIKKLRRRLNESAPKTRPARVAPLRERPAALPRLVMRHYVA